MLGVSKQVFFDCVSEHCQTMSSDRLMWSMKYKVGEIFRACALSFTHPTACLSRDFSRERKILFSKTITRQKTFNNNALMITIFNVMVFPFHSAWVNEHKGAIYAIDEYFVFKLLTIVVLNSLNISHARLSKCVKVIIVRDSIQITFVLDDWN